MLVVVSDTHETERPRLDGALQESVREADRVVHAGDFTTEAVVDGFETVSRGLLGVHGNADTTAVRNRLPAARTVPIGEYTLAVTHTQQGGQMGLSYFGAERDADVVISGHTHRPHVEDTGDVLLLNPGSHADPRGGEATFAELWLEDGTLVGRIRSVGGEERRRFRVEDRNGGPGAESVEG